MSATNLRDIAARSTTGQSAPGADLLPDVTYELEVDDHLGHGAWRLREVEIVEELSGEYAATLSLENEDPTSDERELGGTSATLVMRRGVAHEERRFSGIVHSVVSEGITANAARRARVVVVPAFKCLDQTIDWQKFVNMTVPEILRAVLRSGLEPFRRQAKLNLSRESSSAASPFAVREYTAQRGESLYRFVQRLCSEEGLALWYDNSGPVETLMVTDDNGYFARLPDPLRLVPPGGVGSSPLFESLSTFEIASHRTPAAASVNRFDLTRPMVPLLERVQNQAPASRPAAGGAEVYDPTGAITLHRYQGDRYTGEDARLQARLRLESIQVGAQVGSGQGDVIAFQPGLVFTLAPESGYPSPLEGEHLITSVRHMATISGRSNGAAAARPASYHNSFTTIPRAVPFRAPRIPRPIAGFDYAVVAALSDDDPIHHDIHGRVKVKFWWDRTPGDPNHNDSGWIPVTVPWAGLGRGVQAVPRQGDVVTVSYELGDPDRPVVTGSVNTGTNRLLHDLAAKTVVAWRTQSQRPDGHGGFNTPNYNELLMDDKANAENFSIHAGWNYNQTVLNDDCTNIANDECRRVGGNQSLDVEKNQTIDVDGNRTVCIGKNDALDVYGSETIDIEGSESVSVGGSQSVSVGGSQSVSVGGSQSVTVSGARTTTVVGPDINTLTSRGTQVAGSDETHVAANSVLVADGKVIIKQGGTTIELAGGHVCIDAAAWVQIKHGGAEVKIDGGDNVMVQTGAKATIKASEIDFTADKITFTGHSGVSMISGGSEIKAEPGGVTLKGPTINGTADGECKITAAIIHAN